MNKEEIQKKNTEFINFLRENGFIYFGSEIYGGLSNTWDYGPIGSLIKDKIKKLWKKHFIFLQENNFLFDSSIMLNPKVWEASGHAEKFNDPLIDCKVCKTRYRADHLAEEIDPKLNTALLTNEQLQEIIYQTKCKKCNSRDWTPVREFKLMFETSNSKTKENNIYLRPETAQGIFINFNNYKQTIFGKVPFGIGQIGKAFRNEITPGNFIFRTKEFEQMELELFVENNIEVEQKWFNHYLELINNFLIKLNFEKDLDYRLIDVKKEELAHYSKQTIDFEFNFYFGWGELLGLANRGDFDLSNHSKHSNNDLSYLDPYTNQKYFPSVIETSIGVERLMLAVLWKAYNSQINNFLNLPFELSPYSLAILPLSKNEIELANKLKQDLIEKPYIENILLLDKGNIGKRYKRVDKLGIRYVLTVDSNFVSSNTLTIRDAKTKEQQEISPQDILKYLF